MFKKKYFDYLCSKMYRENINESYYDLIDFYNSLSKEEKINFDTKTIEEIILFKIENHAIMYEIIDNYCNIINPSFREEVNKIIETKKDTKLLCDYLYFNDLEEEKYINLSIIAIKNIFPEKEEEIDLLQKLKLKLQEKGLYEKIIDKIKSSGDITLIVSTALCFESKLIDDIFEGKENMYLYLLANTFTDEDDIKYYKKRLLKLEDNNLKKTIKLKAKTIDEKIKGKLN